MLELSETKRALLARLVAHDAAAGQTGIPPAPAGRPVPLSFAQERVWFTERLLPGEPLFNLVGGVVLDGPVEPDVVRRRLAGAVADHDALRTSIQLVDEEPVLVVADRVSVSLPVIDHSTADPERAAALAAQAALRLGAPPYRLDRAPLWRVGLVRMPAGRTAVVLGTHHVIMDAISLVLLVHALCGHPPPPPRVRYADFAAWQRSPAWAESTAQDLAYWQRRLANPPAPLRLPEDFPRPPARTLRGASLITDLDPELIRRMRDLGRQAGATLYATFLAAFKVLLRRLTAADDLLVLCPVNGRARVELRPLLGMFANMVVVRTRLAGGSTFREAITRVRDGLAAALTHQSAPFERVVSELGASGRGPYPPLAQVGFNMAAQEASVGLPPLDLPMNPNRSELDLTVHIVPGGGGLKLEFEYATELFEEPTVRRMLDSFLVLLAGLVAAPDRPVDEVPLLRPADRALLAAGRGPGPSCAAVGRGPDLSRAAAGTGSELLIDLFARQAAATPGRVALIHAGDTLTYGELARRAGALAHRLRRLGVVPETPVGIYLRRGFDLVAALLAVWQAGAAYVPLDPDQPAPRTGLILRETALPVLLTSADLLAGAVADVLDGVPHDVLCVDAAMGALQVPPTPPTGVLEGTPFPARPRPDNAAYVIYTSGSTGRPKGVVITHGGIANRVLWGVREHGLGPDDRVLQKTRLTFDAAGWEIFAPLVSGGAVVLAPSGVEEDPDAMLGAVADHRATVLQVVPSVLRLLADSPRWASCRSVRLLCSAGEPLDAGLCARILDRADLRIVNTYGPTECAIDVSAMEHDPRQRSGPVPIGRPIDNIRLYVLDPAGEPVPAGIPGQLCAGGAGVGRGYLNRPDLTAASFVPDPFGRPGDRLYRTGDLARWRHDGALEFRGRVDQQVKLNGVRVEPGEVEYTLRGCPGVRAVAVVPRPDGDGGVSLVAYVVGDVTADAVRRFARERLPGPMTPARYVLLAELPLTSTGKLDRAALPEPGGPGDDGGDGVPHMPPRDRDEELIAAAWAEILQVERVGAHDDFFALGGHSLLLTRVVAKLRILFGVEVPLNRLFTALTVAEQAELVRAYRAAGRAAAARSALAR